MFNSMRYVEGLGWRAGIEPWMQGVAQSPLLLPG